MPRNSKTTQQIFSKSKQEQDFWINFESFFCDFYDFIISPYLKGIFSETSHTFNVVEISKDLKNQYLQIWKKITIQLEKGLEISNIVEWCEQILHDEIKNSLQTPELIFNMIVEMICNTSLDLINLITLPESKSKEKKLELNYSYMQDLDKIICETVLTTYFDMFILSETMKILLYTENLTFNEIYEIRVHLLDIFTKFLYDTKMYSLFLDFFEDLQKRYRISLTGTYIQNFILSFLISLAKDKNSMEQITEFCKKQIMSRNKWNRTQFNIPLKQTIEIVEDWVKNQIEEILQNYIPPSMFNSVEFKSSIFNIIHNQILSRISAKKAKNEVKTYLNENLYTKYEKKNNFTPVLLDNLIFGLIEILDNQLSLDPSLENFAETISSTQIDSLPGGDEFYI